MKNIKRIVSLCLVFTLMASLSAFAAPPSVSELNEKYFSDMVDIDRVYKYDFVEAREEEEEIVEVVVKYPEAIQIVTALGLMEYSGDTFGEDEIVPFNEFAQILMKLSIGTEPYYEEVYSQYGDVRATLMGEAVDYIIEAIGYHVFEGKYASANPRHQIARQIDILDGISFNPDKAITKGELASIIAEAVQVDRVDLASVGEYANYAVIENSSILREEFSSIIVEGVVTAVPGMRLYSGKTLEGNEIEIDRAVYKVKDLDNARFFGHRVIAIVEINDYNERVISIEMSQDDNTVIIPISDIRSISSEKLTYYEGEEQKRISLSGISTVTCNGEASNISLLSEPLLQKSGEIILCSVNSNTKYDVAAVRYYQDFVVESISTVSEKISLANGQKLNNRTYISALESGSYKLNIMKDGYLIPYTSLVAGDVITVTANDSYSSINVVVSTKVVNGKITTKMNDTYVIGNNKYEVSSSYENSALVNFALPKLEIGLQGAFYLSFDGKRIVNVKSSATATHYGFMTKIGTGEGLDDSVSVYIFTDDGSWETYNLAEKLTFDGDKKTERGVAYNTIMEQEDEVLNNLVRYSLNADGEISFLDTSRIKRLQLGEVDSEASDARRLVAAGEWRGKFNWKKRGALSGSKYLLADNTVVFNIPEKIEDEEAYTVSKNASFPSDTDGYLQLYSPDKFNVLPVVVQGVSAAALDENNRRYFLVTDLCGKKDEDGETLIGVNCLDYSGSGKWNMTEYYIDPTLKDEFEDVGIGDLVFYVASGNIIKDFEIRVPKEERDTDLSYNLLTHNTYALGNVTDISIESNLIKMETGGSECVFTPVSIGIHESGAEQGRAAALGDINVGDRIYVFGTYKEFCVLVLR